ncbi:EAL domain-containing protein [Aromatoleum buckelii]|uniref:EAL domain-containing protein n=1 Tax=Aromatoleum buckelii TaxID=200254 RepID=A0ABX1N7R3_9RHOO|nr:EAL domain-containing protein [Aromatoleum buckelii]MCK0509738.1 EAL domain-containing protein [Aromatoleum buckelii]
MPVGILKVDRTFVTELADTGPDPAIVRGIIALAHQLELEVIVEGVETAIQYDLVRKMGCDVVQGYRPGRAISPLTATAPLRSEIFSPTGPQRAANRISGVPPIANDHASLVRRRPPKGAAVCHVGVNSGLSANAAGRLAPYERRP